MTRDRPGFARFGSDTFPSNSVPDHWDHRLGKNDTARFAVSAGCLVPCRIPFATRGEEHICRDIVLHQVCSFLFPIGLSGNFFASSRAAAVRVLAANLYALILKLVSRMKTG